MDLASRRPGPDVVRALAMLGVVVMNYHGYLIIRGARRAGGAASELFDPWSGPFSNRFAALFVLTAGVGVSLMTHRDRSADMRWRLARRGMLLFGVGLLFDMIWPGTILTYYGAMFVLAAALLTVPSGWLAVLAGAAAVIGQLVTPEPGGLRSPAGLVVDVLFHGTHPLFPWLAYFLTGIVIGRSVRQHGWRPSAAVAGITLFGVALLINRSAGSSLAPPTRTIASTLGALGVVVLAFTTISAVADRWERSAVIRALQQAGQLSLSIYLSHALVFNLLVDWLDLVRPGGVATSLTFAFTVWATATAAAIAYRRHFGRGPAEILYRRLTA